MKYVIAYDMESDRRRAKLAKILEGFGDRVQYSVFEADLNSNDLRRLLKRLRIYINPETDSLRIYPLCAECLADVVNIGQALERLPKPGEIVIT